MARLGIGPAVQRSIFLSAVPKSRPRAATRTNDLFNRIKPAGRKTQQVLARADEPERDPKTQKAHRINMLGGRRYWRQAKQNANNDKHVQATIDAMLAGVLCATGVCVHYTSRAVSALIKRAG